MKWKRLFWASLMILLVDLGALIQCGLTDRVRGGPMAMPFLLTVIWIVVLIAIYAVVFACDQYLKTPVLRVGALLVQGVVLFVTAKKMKYDWDIEQGNIPIHEYDDNYYAAGSEAYMAVVFFSIIISSYFIARLVQQQRRKTAARIVSG